MLWNVHITFYVMAVINGSYLTSHFLFFASVLKLVSKQNKNNKKKSVKLRLETPSNNV